MAKSDYGVKYLKLAPAAEKDLSGYYQVDSTTTGALKVVAANATPGEGEIKITSVTPYKSAKELAVNDYVKEVSIPIGSFIDFDTIVGLPTMTVEAIAKGSFQHTDTPPSVTNVEIEDSDDYYATIETDNGSKGFTLQTYDKSEKAFKYFLGYVKEGDKLREPISFTLPNQCVEIRTLEQGSNPAKIYRFARMSLRVTSSGTLGKETFPTFTLEFTKLANYDANGNEISGAEWEPVTD
jgi:hypothetical protein